ncbi:MAG: hypothetical protein ABSH05_07950 [Bryobacteraceae bacterium]|jgi:hypothetical protein
MSKLVRVVLVVVLAGGCFGAEPVRKKNWKKQWVISAVALAAANIFDAHSSMGRMETNPLLRNSQGQFNGARGVAFKSAAAGGMLVVQSVLARRNPEMYKTGTVVNFVAAGALGVTAARNSR